MAKQTRKKLAGTIAIGIAIGLFGLFQIPEAKAQAAFSTFCVALGLLVAFVGIRDYRRAAKKLPTKPSDAFIPDLLGQLGGPLLECRGLSVLVVPEVRAETCVLAIFFQNRYENTCHTSIRLYGPQAMEFTIAFACAGGGVGVTRVPIGVPPELQGTEVTFGMTADTVYEDGRGRNVRPWSGVAVGRPVRTWENLVAWIAVFFAPFGGNFRERAIFSVHLPTGVVPVETIRTIQTKHVWGPGDPPPPDGWHR